MPRNNNPNEPIGFEPFAWRGQMEQMFQNNNQQRANGPAIIIGDEIDPRVEPVVPEDAFFAGAIPEDVAAQFPMRGEAVDPANGDMAMYYESMMRQKNAVPAKPEEYVYRVILSHSGQEIINLKVEKSMEKMSSKELLDLYENGGRGIEFVANIPNPRIKELPVARNPWQVQVDRLGRRRPGVMPRAEEAVMGIPGDQFIRQSVGAYRQGVPLSADLLSFILGYYGADTFRNTIDTRAGTCKANIPVRCVMGNQTWYGFTTGVFLADGINAVEVIATQAGRSANTFINGHFIRMEVPYRNVIPLFQPNAICRIRVRSSQASSEAFGFKQAKRRMEGQVYAWNQYRMVPNFESVKLGRRLHLVEIQMENGTFVKFLPEDLELMIPTAGERPLMVINRQIVKNCLVKIKDDRRLRHFQKGDVVRVLNITPGKNGGVRSTVAVTGENGQTEIVLLKQVKFHESAPKKEVPVKQQRDQEYPF